jgi:hypothetical protein
MNVHVINRAETWPTARPFISETDLVIWTDTASIRNLSTELKSVGLRVVCLASDGSISYETQEFPVITDQEWVQYVLDATTLCSWG